MIKPVLIFFFIGFGLGILAMTCGGKQEILADPEIHRLKEEIGWNGFKETKLNERIKKDSLEKIALSKDVINERQKAQRANQNFQKAEQRYLEVRKAIPLTRKDTVDFLVQDTVSCDSALAMARNAILEAKELAAKLTIEVMADDEIIQNLDSLNTDLQADKKNLIKIDTLHQINEKKIEKKAKKNFWKGLSWGAITLVAAELAWKLILLVL